MPMPSAQENMNAESEYSIAKEQATGTRSWPPEQGGVERLVVRHRQRISSIILKDVDWISSARNYVEFHHRNEVLKSRSTLAKVAALVPSKQFLRINRRTIVNLESVEVAKSSSNGAIRIWISGGTELVVSRRYSARVRNILAAKARSLHAVPPSGAFPIVMTSAN